MSTFPLRVGRSRSIWEDGSPTEIVRKEFPRREGGVDLRPSVYIVEGREALRATAEHLVQYVSPPSKIGVFELNLAGLARAEARRANGAFDFTNSRHAELIVESQEQLEAFVEVLRADESRRVSRDRAAIVAYVKARVGGADPEWLRVLSEKPKWNELVQA